VTSAGVKIMLAVINGTTLIVATSMLVARRAVTTVTAKATTTVETIEIGGSSSRKRNFQTEERLDI